MQFKIVGKQENKLLSRLEVRFDATHVDSPTPTRADLRKQLAATLGIGPEEVLVKDVQSVRGSAVSHGTAYVYKDQNLAKLHGLKHIAARHEKAEKKTEEAKKKAEESAKAAAEAAPAPAEASEEKPAEISAPTEEASEGEQ